MKSKTYLTRPHLDIKTGTVPADEYKSGKAVALLFVLDYLIHQAEGTAVKILDKTLEMFYTNRDEMRSWQKSNVTDEQVAKLLSDTICKKPLADLKKKADANIVTINQKLFDYLMYRYWEEVGSLGKNLWSVYNALTHWSTHTTEEWERQNDKGIFVILKTSRGSSNPDLVATRRQDAVRDVLQSKEWKQLYKTN